MFIIKGRIHWCQKKKKKKKKKAWLKVNPLYMMLESSDQDSFSKPLGKMYNSFIV